MKTLKLTSNDEVNLLVALDFYLDSYTTSLRKTTQSLLSRPNDVNLKSKCKYYCSRIDELQSLKLKINK